MKFLRNYFKQRFGVIVIMLLFAGVFALVFALFSLPMKAVYYPFLVCGVMGVVILAADMARVYKKHRSLEEIKRNGAQSLRLPEVCSTVVEKDMAEIIKALCSEFSEEKCEYDESRRKASEYYTLWAHQIKTPISSMYLMLYSEDTPMSRMLLSDLSRIDRYVGMALTYLKLDSDGSDYVLKRHSLDKLIKKSVKSFSSEFILRKLSLTYDGTEKSLITDEKWFCFVLEQLLSNALKYTPSGGITISIGDDNILCIADTGIGIAPEDLPRIFEHGYTGENGRKNSSASGIGLYLCRRICDNLGIKLSAASEPDVGTKVYLDLTQYNLKTE